MLKSASSWLRVDVGANTSSKTQDFEHFWSFRRMLHQFTSQRAILCVTPDNEEGGGMFTGVLHPVFLCTTISLTFEVTSV